MPLPPILLPAGVPCVLVAGHSVAPDGVFDPVAMRQGETRMRRVYTTAPRVVGVGWAIDDDVMQALDEWFEETLDRGARQFSVEVQRLGVGREWWAAEWVTPYDADPRPPDKWSVTGSLRLVGEPSDERPETGALGLDIVVSLGASASLSVPAPLALDIVVSLDVAVPLSLEIVVSLGFVDRGGFELRAGGGYELRADGGRELRV